MNFVLSSRTQEIIENFSSINPSILFREGNVLKTISPSKDIFAVAVIPEVIPQEFAIYDLSRFLGALSLFDNPTIAFQDKSLVIQSENRQLNYVYAAPNAIIIAPDKEMGLPETVAEFEISEKVLLDTKKALNLLRLPQVVFTSDGSSVILQAADVKNPTGDTYFSKVGESQKSFKVVLNADKLSKILLDDYKVTLTYGKIGDSRDNIAVSVFESKDVKFFIVPEENSQYDG